MLLRRWMRKNLVTGDTSFVPLGRSALLIVCLCRCNLTAKSRCCRTARGLNKRCEPEVSMMMFAGFDLLVSASALVGLWIYVRLATALSIKIKCPDLLGAVISGVIIGQSGFGLSEALVGHGLHFDMLLKSAYWTGLIALMFIT